MRASWSLSLLLLAHCTLANDLSELSTPGDKGDAMRGPMLDGGPPAAPMSGDQDSGVLSDLCPGDPNKTTPGACGCGRADDDGDGDGVPDCTDQCPRDVEKSSPDRCGCGMPDADGDGDGVVDCEDACPDDPGPCVCGGSDSDRDGDGVVDCEDACPDDPNKASAGVCGCGTSDADSDGDGTFDCRDDCPKDPNKQAFGECGCGVAENDDNGNDVPDCAELSTVVFSDDFESGMQKWNVYRAWRTRVAAQLQPPDHGANNSVASARDCYRCGMDSVPIESEGALALEITFYRYVSEELDSSDEEYLDLWVYSRGEYSFVHSWTPPEDDDSEWHAEWFDLTPYAADDLAIGFYARSSNSYELVQIDDVVVTMTSRRPVVLNRP